MTCSCIPLSVGHLTDEKLGFFSATTPQYNEHRQINSLAWNLTYNSKFSNSSMLHMVGQGIHYLRVETDIIFHWLCATIKIFVVVQRPS